MRKGRCPSSPTLGAMRPPSCSPSLDLVLGQGLNHLGAEVIYRLHLCGLEGQLAHLGALRGVTCQARAERGPRCLPSTASEQACHREALGGDGCLRCHDCGGGFVCAHICPNLASWNFQCGQLIASQLYLIKARMKTPENKQKPKRSSLQKQHRPEVPQNGQGGHTQITFLFYAQIKGVFWSITNPENRAKLNTAKQTKTPHPLPTR